MASGSSKSSTPMQATYGPDTESVDADRRFLPGLTPVSLFIVLMLVWLTTKIGLVLVLGLLALVLGTVLEGPVSRLQDRHLPRAAAIATVYVAVIGVVVALVFLIVPIVQDQADEFQQQIPQQLGDLRDSWRSSDSAILSNTGADLLQSAIDTVDRFGSGNGVQVDESTARNAIPIITNVGSGLVSLISVLVITFYYLLEKRLIRQVVLDQITPRHRGHIDSLWSEVENKVGGWLRGQLLLCLIIGTIATVSYGVIGVSFWPLLGLWAGITEIIPIVGPWIGGVPAVIVAFTDGWKTAALVGLVIICMQSLENWFLVPRVMRGAVGLTPLTVFVAILAGTQLMGPAGGVLAIPIAASVQVVLDDYLKRRQIRFSSSGGNISGWRWMLNRGMGRDNPVLVDGEAPDDGVQTVGGNVPIDDSSWPSEREERGPDHPSATTWPANPWKRAASNRQAGRGTVPAVRESGTPASRISGDRRPRSSSTDTEGSNDAS